MVALLLSALLAAEVPVADSLTLRDGTVVAGLVVEPAPKGKVLFLVRRALAEAKAPEWQKRWAAAEAASSAKAREQRLARLKAWRRERKVEGADEVAAWLDAEIPRVEAGGGGPSALMLLAVPRADVRKLDRRPAALGKLLRRGWLVKFAEPERMEPAELASALEGRGYLATAAETPSVDNLLPTPSEPDETWRLRRAATEVAAEPGLRYIRHLGLVLPESSGMDGPGAQAAVAGSALKALIGGEGADPMEAKAREAGDRGRTGLVVTRLEIAEDLSAVKVESSLWVKAGPERWQPALSRASTVRPDALHEDEGKALADDPQVQAAFKVVEGLGNVSPEMARRSLKVGAATRRAMGEAREALRKDLSALEFSLDNRAAAPKPSESKAP